MKVLILSTRPSIRSAMCFLPVLVMVSYYAGICWRFPMSEDAGFYGYVARCIANGKVLHSEFPIASNSLGLYATALVFNVFGASLDVYRGVHAIVFVLLIYLVYRAVAKVNGIVQGAASALLGATAILIPQVTLDLGRHYIYWSLALVLLGVHLKSSNAKHGHAYLGACLGLASLIRETFLIVPLAYGLGWGIQWAWARVMGTARNAPKQFAMYTGGLACSLALNAVLLTINGSWSDYLRDMLQSGASFRYASGALGLGRLAANVGALQYGFANFYAPVLILGASSYLIKFESPFINTIKFLLIPTFIVEALVINRTTEYSIIPTLLVASILAVASLASVVRAVREKHVLTISSAVCIALIGTGLVRTPGSVVRTYRDYAGFVRGHEGAVQASPEKQNEHTMRLLQFAEAIPHATIAANSQFPLLFLASRFYFSDALVEDLTLPDNMSRPDLRQRQTEQIESRPPDLFFVKTTNSFPSGSSGLGRLVDDRYIVVADFGVSEGMTAPYKDRVLLSRAHLRSHFDRWNRETVDIGLSEQTLEVSRKNTADAGVIVHIQPPAGEIAAFSVSVGRSRIAADAVATTDNSLWALVPAGMEFRIVSTRPSPVVLLEYYRPRQQSHRRG